MITSGINSQTADWLQVRRLMEEENKKERKGIKRSHNDAVRELVAFVRKRDKRLAAHQSSEAKKRLQREEEDKQRLILYQPHPNKHA